MIEGGSVDRTVEQQYSYRNKSMKTMQASKYSYVATQLLWCNLFSQVHEEGVIFICFCEEEFYQKEKDLAFTSHSNIQLWTHVMLEVFAKMSNPTENT